MNLSLCTSGVRADRPQGFVRLRARGGFTLTEIAIVMGVIGLILGAVWWAAGNARESQKANDALNELQTVAQNIDLLMTGQKFPGLYTWPTSYTPQMITAQTIPSTYVNKTVPTTADNPWNAGSGGAGNGFMVWVTPDVKHFRLAFYQVSYKGCLALLLKGTSCQFGQSGCPTGVHTNRNTVPATNTCQPAPNNCAGVAATGVGWATMNVPTASTLCAMNSYNGGNNSVEFDYAP